MATEQFKFGILCLKLELSRLIIELPYYLIQCYPYLMLKHIPRLRELLDYFTFMDVKVGSYFISAPLFLIKFNYDLPDYTILVVSRVVFKSEYIARLTATFFVLDLVLSQKQPEGNVLCFFRNSSTQETGS